MPRPQRLTTSTGARLLRALGLVALMPLLAGGLLSGCGGSGSPSASKAAVSERSREEKAETRFQDFARCLREHGVHAEALRRPGGGHGLKISPGNAGSGHAAMEGAEKACARYRPEPQNGNPSPQQKVELQEAVQRFAKCMREHGIKVEASGSGGAIRIAGKPGSGGPNPESPDFQRAQNACQRLLPGGGPRGQRTPERGESESGAGTG